jgi:serine protease Do
MSSRFKVGTALATVGAAGIALGLGLSAELGLGGRAAAQSAGPVPPTTVTLPATPPTGPGVSFVRLAKEVGPAVVNINVKIGRATRGGGDGFNPFNPFNPFGGGPQGEGQGTGFLISPDGYILTNEHVVGEASSINVALSDGRELPGKVVGADARTDIALVKIEDKKAFPHVRLGDSDKVEIGEWVVAIGNPFGLDHSVTAGIVSAKGRRSIRPSGRRGLYDFIQTDASINPGNSGGPLINVNGEVIGINAAVNMAGQGIGFAIPINMAKTLLPQLKEHGKVSRSYLGVQLQDLSRDLAKSMGLSDTNGAIVARVVRGSPADKAGLKPGDVITSFDGKPVKSTDDVVWLASTTGAGKTVTVGVAGSGGDKRSVKITLAPMPEEEVASRGPLPPEGKGTQAAALGVAVTEVTPEIARELGLDQPQGVVVTSVDRRAAAAGALRRGDVIVSVNDRPVSTEKDFVAATSGTRDGATLRMLIVRDGVPMWLAFTV